MKRNYPRAPAEKQQWWRDHVKKVDTPFFAKSPSTLSPVTVQRDLPDASLFSGGLGFESGFRHHCFGNQKDRDRFLTKFRKFGAQAVGKDPCP